jgi:NhaA family Na+:H+ antiporter
MNVRLPPFLRNFAASPASGGIVLILATALALVLANSPAREAYFNIRQMEIGGLTLLHWVNDGLMAVFFLMVGLEIKREALEGELATWQRRILPGFAALGGMIVPAIVFLSLNAGEGGHPRGWAIPAATDIAFALGVLSLLGRRAPQSLRVFLTALAVLDDLGAVIIIALFYAGPINVPALCGALGVWAALLFLGRMKVARLWPYLAAGLVLWLLLLQSGVHAALAGVALAFCIPLRAGSASPLHRLEHGIAPWVAFLVVPIFGLANAGVSFAGVSMSQLSSPLPLGIAAGLFIGKQLGVFTFAAAAIRAGWADMPRYTDWRQLYGVALLCGIGFTMSLFIGISAFPVSLALQDEVKLGVLFGSFLSAAAGAFLLYKRPVS